MNKPADELETQLDITIAGAVNARIKAEVLRALSGDEVIGAYVSAALQQPVEVPDGRGYGKTKVPFLTHTLQTAIREATKTAVRNVIATELPSIEEEVRKALKRDIRKIASTLAQSLSDAAAKPYGVDVSLDLKMPGRD